MRRRRFYWELFWMVVLITAALASAALAINPLVYRAEKTREISMKNSIVPSRPIMSGW